jgi:hypothetical protein
LLFSVARGVLTARTAAGTGAAAPAATTQRVGGSDGKAGSVTGLHEVNLDGPAFFQEILVNKKSQTIFLKNLIAAF